MHPFPHHYTVIADGNTDGATVTHAEGLPPLPVASPREFGGPGNLWSPETLLCAAVADCFILTFRSVAQAMHLPWVRLECDVTGTLERVERVTLFTQFDIHARLGVPADNDAAHRALEKAHQACLIANSLKARMDLQAEIYVTDQTTSASEAVR